MTHSPSLADIAAKLEAYDPQALPVSEVLKFLDLLLEPVQDSESVDIFAALGRVTSQDVISPINVPSCAHRCLILAQKRLLGFSVVFVKTVPSSPKIRVVISRTIYHCHATQ